MDEEERCSKVLKEKRRKINLPENTVCRNNDCIECKRFLLHKVKKNQAREAYHNDKEKVDQLSMLKQTDTLFLSSDMQKVILLPRLPGFKLCLFTKRIVTINQSLAPIKRKDTKLDIKPLGVLWHEVLMGRNDEDVSSAYLKAMKSPKFRDYNHFVIWLDNCAGQNKNWALITVLTQFVNQVDGPQSITLKYFAEGHTFMSADSFHKGVEDAMRKMGEVCDWNDFVSCVEEAGASIDMEITDFYNFISGLSSSMAPKNSKPRWNEVVVAEFCKGSSCWFYKKS